MTITKATTVDTDGFISENVDSSEGTYVAIKVPSHGSDTFYYKNDDTSSVTMFFHSVPSASFTSGGIGWSA